MIPVNIVIEDELSEAVVRRLLGELGTYEVVTPYKKHGSGAIKRGLKGYNAASQYTPFVVLTDFDQEECAPVILRNWIDFEQHPNLIFRVAVREVEAWLLADREGFAFYAAVSKKRIPLNPDLVEDPKALLFEIIKKSQKRTLKEDILPRYLGDRIGPNYNGRLVEFVAGQWDVGRASENSPSLKKAIEHLRRFSVSRHS
jgi:hypothetical protein